MNSTTHSDIYPRLYHNLKCNFADYDYFLRDFSFENTYKLESNSFLNRDVTEVLSSPSHCKPFGVFHRENESVLIKLFKQPKNQILLSDYWDGLNLSRPGLFNIKTNESKVYWRILQLSNSPRLRAKDFSRNIISLELKDRNHNLINLNDYSVKEVSLYKKNPYTNNDAIISKSMIFKKSSNNRISLTLNELASIWELCPSQREQFLSYTTKYFVRVILTTPDNKEIKGDSPEFLFQDNLNFSLRLR